MVEMVLGWKEGREVGRDEASGGNSKCDVLQIWRQEKDWLRSSSVLEYVSKEMQRIGHIWQVNQVRWSYWQWLFKRQPCHVDTQPSSCVFFSDRTDLIRCLCILLQSPLNSHVSSLTKLLLIACNMRGTTLSLMAFGNEPSCQNWPEHWQTESQNTIFSH